MTSPTSDLMFLSIRTAREAALQALEEHRSTGQWVSDILDRIFRESKLNPVERPLAMELACGVVRRQATLDTILRELVARPADQVEDSLWTILQLGVYQVILLEGIPPHAAVHETVELCKRIGRMRWSGFVNGVLRGATRLRTDQITDQPSSAAVPIGNHRFRLLSKPVFADPTQKMAHYWADAYSFPDWLAAEWTSRFAPSELFHLGDWFNSPTPLIIRFNSLKCDPSAAMAAFREQGIPLEPIDDTDSARIDGKYRIESLPGYDEGWFAVQDLSASSAARRLNPHPGQRVWDVCAAPGGKTCHLAQLMQNEGHIVATDIRTDRLKLVDQNATRLGASIIQTQLIDEAGARLPAGPFDAILVDVPCSNTGVLGKRPEARWRITPDGIRSLAHLQRLLLTWSLERLAPGGRLVYSTCSIEPVENAELVRHVLGSCRGAELLEEETFLPGRPTDGAYQALLTIR